MPFGLTNAPATFQALMNHLRRDLVDVCVVVYLDDILIAHSDWAEHRRIVAEVAAWPTPENRKDMQQFLGFTNFYRRFIEGFSNTARPLFDLTKKGVPWTWGPAEQSVFDDLKAAVTSHPILLLPDEAKWYQLEADSSDFATGAVLSQEGADMK